MKKAKPILAVLRTAGYSLVEVMIAMALGLIILLAVTALFVANKEGSRVIDDKARMEQEGRLAINLMAFHLRMAGSGALVSTSITLPDKINPTKTVKGTVLTNFNGGSMSSAKPSGVFGCANGFVDKTASFANLACVAPTNSATDKDAIAVRYVVDANNSNLSAGGQVQDCLGAAILPTPDPDKPGVLPDFFVVESRFFVRNNAVTGVSELYCLGNGTTLPGANLQNSEQPIAENVEQFRIKYGYTSIDDAQITNQQRTATEVAKWENVISARLCVVMISANNGSVTSTQKYRDCDDVLQTAPDLRMRTVYSSVVAIRAKSAGNL